MQELIEKYNISESFYRRYFEENAQNRFGTELQKFMWFKEGKFLNPMKKNQIINDYIKEEIINFYEKNEFNIPQIEFCLTTRCTLKCKDCNALMPKFRKKNCHIDMSFVDFKTNVDRLCNIANQIRHFVLIGGEPLLQPNLPEMLEYVCLKDNIDIIRILTNGTIIPSEKLLNVLKKYNKKVYVYISNYAVTDELKQVVKHEEIKKALKNVDIKNQLIDSWSWFIERGFSKTSTNENDTIIKFNNCTRTNCVQLLNNKIDVCSKACSGRELNFFNNSDFVDLEKSLTLKKDFVKFYQNPYQEACKYCNLNDGTVQPAIQIE